MPGFPVLYGDKKNSRRLSKYDITVRHSDMKTVDITTEIIINAPSGRVATYAANPDNAPEWYVNIKDAEMENNAPISQRFIDCIQSPIPR